MCVEEDECEAGGGTQRGACLAKALVLGLPTMWDGVLERMVGEWVCGMLPSHACESALQKPVGDSWGVGPHRCSVHNTVKVEGRTGNGFCVVCQ